MVREQLESRLCVDWGELTGSGLLVGFGGGSGRKKWERDAEGGGSEWPGL